MRRPAAGVNWLGQPASMAAVLESVVGHRGSIFIRIGVIVVGDKLLLFCILYAPAAGLYFQMAGCFLLPPGLPRAFPGGTRDWEGRGNRYFRA